MGYHLNGRSSRGKRTFSSPGSWVALLLLSMRGLLMHHIFLEVRFFYFGHFSLSSVSLNNFSLFHSEFATGGGSQVSGRVGEYIAESS